MLFSSSRALSACAFFLVTFASLSLATAQSAGAVQVGLRAGSVQREIPSARFARSGQALHCA